MCDDLEVCVLSCPYCAARIFSRSSVCEYCGHEYLISSFSNARALNSAYVSRYIGSYDSFLKENPDDPELNFAVGICHLSLRTYEKARSFFENAIDRGIMNSEAYYLAAISLLGGRKAFVNTKKDVDKAIEYMHAACALEEKPAYRLFLAYLKFDYYKRKCLRIDPDYRAEIRRALELSLSESEFREMFEILNIECPDGFGLAQ